MYIWCSRDHFSPVFASSLVFLFVFPLHSSGPNHSISTPYYLQVGWQYTDPPSSVNGPPFAEKVAHIFCQSPILHTRMTFLSEIPQTNRPTIYPPHYLLPYLPKCLLLFSLLPLCTTLSNPILIKHCHLRVIQCNQASHRCRQKESRNH